MLTSDLITAALQEINVCPAGDTPSAEDMAFGLNKLNLLLDTWATDESYVYNKDFSTYTLIPNHQPHTIGASGADFTVTQAPVKIEAASLILTNSAPNVGIPLPIRDADWWADERIKALTSTSPTDLYYSQASPNGKIFLWPIPTIAYKLELETWVVLNQIATIATVLNLPTGYQAALTYSLAESWPAVTIDPMLIGRAKNARLAVQGVNIASPRMGTVDSGMPVGGGTRSTWNFRTGTFR